MPCDVVSSVYRTCFELDRSFFLHPSSANKRAYLASLILLITKKVLPSYNLLLQFSKFSNLLKWWLFKTFWETEFVWRSYLMRAVLTVSCSFCWSPLWGALDDGVEEDGGRVAERRDEGRTEDEDGGRVWLDGFLPFRRRRRDLTLRGWTRLWLLRRLAALPKGPVPALLKVCSDLETESQRVSRSR